AACAWPSVPAPAVARSLLHQPRAPRARPLRRSRTLPAAPAASRVPVVESRRICPRPWALILALSEEPEVDAHQRFFLRRLQPRVHLNRLLDAGCRSLVRLVHEAEHRVELLR